MSVAPPIRLGSANSAVLTPSTGDALTKGARGKLDTLRRSYVCPSVSAYSIIPIIYSADSTYASMYFTEYRITNGEGKSSTVELTYRGLASGLADGPFSEPGLALQTAQATTTASGHQVNLEVQFYAPSTAYSWVATQTDASSFSSGGNGQVVTNRPAPGPTYSSVLGNISPLANIVGYSVQSEDGSDGYVSYSDFVSALNALSIRELLIHFRATEIVPGKFWECESQAVRTLLGN